MTLDELRQKYPDLYQGKNDAEMVYTLSQVTGASPVRVAYDMGLDPSGFAQNEGTMDDLGTSLELGYEQTKRGLANLPNLLYALATGENLYETPEMDNEVARIQGTFSPGYQAAQREIGSAWDEGRYGDYALGLITNPGYTGNQLMQSGAPMVAGGIVGAGIRGVTALGALGSGMLARGAATAAPYIGEAVPSAAIQYKDLLDKDVDPRTAALTGLATGVGVGATAGLGGYLAGKAGYMDPEKFFSGMTRKVGDDTVPLSYKGQIGYGMLAEGAEEAVQSPWEEAMANVAQGKPWNEGLGRAAIEGGIAGGIIGGGFNALAPPLRRITPDQPADLLQDEQQADPAQPGVNPPGDLLQDEQQATPVPPGVNPPGDRTPHIDPLAAERQRQIDAIMGGETSQTIRPGQADPGSLQGLTRDQINQRLIDAAMGGETARTFAPGQYPSDVAADLSQQQAKVNAARAAEQAKKAVEKQYEKAGWQKTPEKIALLETAQAPKLVSGIYGDEARKFVDSVLTMDAKTAGELFTNLSGSKSKSAPWKAAIAKAHLTNLAQQEAQTLAQQAKQNDTVDGPGVPVTPTVAQNAQPTEGAVLPTPTTSSVVQPDGVKAVPEGGTPPVVPVPPPSPTTSETPTQQEDHNAIAKRFGLTVWPGQAPKYSEGSINFPNENDNAFAQKYGADKRTVMAHEVAHGLLSKWKMTGRIAGQNFDKLRAELRRVSRANAQKKWEVASRHANKDQEILADGIAHLILNPEATLPELEAFLGGRANELRPIVTSGTLGVINSSNASTSQTQTKPTLNFSRSGQGQPAPGFFSQLKRVVERAKQTTMPGGQWKAWLKANQAQLGVKQEEIEATGIDEYLDARGKDKVTREEIAAFVENNGVRVEEVTKESDTAKFDKWQLPGGTNYKELLLTLPAKPTAQQAELETKRAALHEELRTAPVARQQEILAELDTLLPAMDRADQTASAGQYQSGHYSEPNILAHVRINERTDTEGRRVLFVEEIQSDWGQQGRDKGFRLPSRTWAEIDKELSEVSRKRSALIDEAASLPDSEMAKFRRLTGEVDELGKRLLELRAEQDAIETNRDRVPTGPFVTNTKSWTALALKRLMTYAVENGFDRVAWTTGEQQAERYNLSKQISDIAWRGGNFVAWDKQGNEVVRQTGTTQQDVADYVGKEVADKLFSQTPQGEGRNALYQLSGEDLNVGGQGMKAFYGSIVPQVANDLLKKLGGGRVGSVAVNISKGKKTTASQQFGFDITPTMRAKVQGGLPLFARKPNKAKQTSGNTVADVERWIAGPKAKLAQWVTNGLNVVQSVDELRARYPGMDIPDDVVGMHEGGYVFLVADNITSANQARKALAHEVVGHLGLERMLGKKGFERIVRQIDSYIRTQNPAVLKALERVKAKYTDDQGKYNLNQVQEASEILAHLAERNPNFGLVREIIARIRMWFAKHGLGNYAAAELNQLLVEAARFTETGFTSFAEGNFRVAPAFMFAGPRAQIADPMALDAAQSRLSAGEDAEQRRNTPIGATQDVPDADMIVTFGEQTAANATQPLPETITFDGVERPTTNSEGKPIHPTEAGVRNFWKWFGDSKVVDNQGRPLVMYHGTDKDFTAFKPSKAGNLGPGIYFTPDAKQAEEYAKTHKGTRVVEVYLRAENPLLIDNSNTSGEQLYDAFPADTDAETIKKVRAAGHDAVWAVNSAETPWGNTAREIAVYEPTQIKSATDNVGTFDGANPNINFMRGPTKQDATNLWDWIKTETEAGVEAFSRKVGLGALTNEQMADRWGKEFAPLKTIANVLDATEAKAAQWEKKAEDADRDWAALTAEQDQLMSEIMGDASLHGYDPDTGQLPVGHISKEQRARVMAAKVILDARWQRLKTLDANGKHKAVAVYRQVRDYHQQRLQEAINYVRAQLQQKGTVRPDDPLLKSLEALEAMGKRPYFPLMRLGDYYVVGMSPQMADLEKRFRAKQLQPDEDALREKLRRDPKHYWVEGTARLATAKRLAEKLRKEMGFAQYNAERYKLANARSHVGQDVGKFEQALEGMALDTKTHDALVEMYEQLLISALPEHHSLKRTLHREGIYGWDKNMRAVFAKTAQTGAWALSRMMHVSDLQQAMSELDEMSKTGEPNAQDARALHNELLARQDLTFTRYEDPLLVQGAMKFSYLSMLGFSPAFWAINLTQPWMVTLPYLTARNGNEFKATSSALWRGVREAFSMIEASTEGKELRTQFNPDKVNKQGQKVRLTADERRMLDTFGADGTLDFTIGYDLGAIAKGGSGKWQKVMRSINAPTHATELANRVGTALAAYRISRQSQHSHEQALEFAKKAVNTTQVNYNPANKARYMQAWAGNRWLPKLAFQFYTYQQAMAYLALSTLRDAIKGDKVAQSTMAWMTGMLGATGGVFALPFAQMSLGAASLIFSALGGGDDEEDVDFQRDLRNLFSDHLPEPVARLLNKGLGSMLLQTDLGARIGMGNLMNPLAFARFEAADKGADTVQEVLFRAGGAPVANVANAVDGLSAMRDVMGALVTGDAPKGSDINDMFAKLFPLKGVRDIFRGNELFNEGVTTGEGEPRLTDFSYLEVALQSAGITPLRKTMYYERNAAIQGAKEAMKIARGDLIREYAQARLAGEPIGPILAKIGAFNRRNPQNRIDQDTLKRSTTQRQKDRQSLDNGILANKENRPYLAAGRWAE